MFNRRFRFALVAFAGLTIVGLAAADIIGSDHDFSGEGWSRGEICLPCHTPHNAIQDVPAPLWNREIGEGQLFTVYSGSGTAEEMLDMRSRLCLSCHDGVTALDSFGGTTGTVMMEGEHVRGTDLTDDHPIGADAVYPNVPYFVSKEIWQSSHGMSLQPLNGEEVVSCTTCHEPHNRKRNDAMLWVDNTGSALCLTCHIK